MAEAGCSESGICGGCGMMTGTGGFRRSGLAGGGIERKGGRGVDGGGRIVFELDATGGSSSFGAAVGGAGDWAGLTGGVYTEHVNGAGTRKKRVL